MVENIIELERFRRASKDSARTVLDLEVDEVLIPYPASPGASEPTGGAISRSP